VAASKTLPLGSTAKVTNLRNGKSATVKIEDRGPYAGDHTLDVTPKTASQLGMKKTGTAPVSIDPVKTP
jgi:rare lipoprotein A